MRAQVNYPAAQIVNSATAPQMSTSASVVATIAPTTGGQKPGFIRVSVSSGFAFVNLVPNTSGTATTGDTIVTSAEALWMNTMSFGAVAFLQGTPGGAAFGSVDTCEEVTLGVSQSATPGLG